MKLYRTHNLYGVWLGAKAIILAISEQHARELLAPELIANGIGQDEYTLEEVDLTVPQAIVLDNGDY